MKPEVSQTDYKSYDYKQVIMKENDASYCIDCYKNFGWLPDENKPVRQEHGQCLLAFKRDRRIANKMELTRLERHFDACISELNELKRSRTVRPALYAAFCGLLGTVFIAGSVFAVTATPPIIWLCVLLAIPGFLGWILPYFIYCRGVAKRTAAVVPFIAAKQEEIDKICEKGHSLL